MTNPLLPMPPLTQATYDDFIRRAQWEIRRLESIDANLALAERKILERRVVLRQHLNHIKTAIEVYRSLHTQPFVITGATAPEKQILFAPISTLLPAIVTKQIEPRPKNRVARFFAAIRRGLHLDQEARQTLVTYPQCPLHKKARRAKDGQWYCPTLIVERNGPPRWCTWRCL